MSLPAVSKHLKLLERANLITRKRSGRVHHLKLCADPMSEANKWLTSYRQFWNERLDSLETYLYSQSSGEEKHDNDKE
jgi:DNA-binding transcriptional ArsR family regulator